MTRALQQIAIFGGTGTVGAELLYRAVDAGYRVRAPARRPDAIDPRTGSA